MPESSPPDPKHRNQSQQEAMVKSQTIDDVLDDIGLSKFHYITFIFCGLSFMGMATEIFLMSYLSECLTQNWDLTSSEEASLSSVVFAGQIFGAVLWGTIGDICGRKKALLYSQLATVVSGFATQLSPNYVILTVMRFIVGVGTGGLMLPINYLAELCPAKSRGVLVSSVGFFWAAGNIYVALFAWVSLPTDEYRGWRTLSFVCMVPIAMAAICSFYFPESPRWLLSRGRDGEAVNVLKGIAQLAGSQLEPFKLVGVIPGGQERTLESASLWDLLGREYWNTNIRVWIIWSCVGFSYYGLVLFLTRVFEKDDNDDDDDISGSNRCKFKFLSMFISALAEIPAAAAPLVLLHRFGRNTLQSFFCVLGALSCICLGVTRRDAGRTLFAFVGRAVLRSAFNVAIVAVTELYPTHMRTFAACMAVFMSRLGAFLSPYLVLRDDVSVLQSSFGLATTSLVMGAVAFMTPDTRDMHLDERISEVDIKERFSSMSFSRNSMDVGLVIRNPIST
mmetsp:Transcript_7160/g.10649  ORF Transcript_7160/g.10649 Transcript_7160/m.10649 type:complete len:506 (-) Transcript_7160:202-1719(-)